MIHKEILFEEDKNQARTPDPPSFANDDGCPLLVDSLAHLDRNLLLNLVVNIDSQYKIEKKSCHLSADQLGNIFALFRVNKERCFLQLVDALLDRHLVYRQFITFVNSTHVTE